MTTKEFLHQLKTRFYNLSMVIEYCNKHNTSCISYLLDCKYDKKLYNGPIDILLYEYVCKQK